MQRPSPSSSCPLCDAFDLPLNRCKAGHIYCDSCALVSVMGGDDEDDDGCAFCPRCLPPPQEFVCPITHELMKAPVVAQDGFTYERTAIEDWLRYRQTSPKTNQAIGTTLFPNFNLKALITEWKLLHCGSA